MLVGAAVLHQQTQSTEKRAALLSLLDSFKRSQVAFVTAYADRESAGFKKTVTGLAWGSFAWFMSEPDKIFMLRDGSSQLSSLNQLVTDQG